MKLIPTSKIVKRKLMSIRMPERRRTDPLVTQHIWDAIKFIVHQRCLPSEERVMRHIARTYGKPEQTVLEDLNNAVKDGLVQLKKGANKNGLEQESYRIPVDLTDVDKHDWYCCKCQRAGVVDCCQNCHRVFHPECHVPENPELKYCNFCEKINKDLFGDKSDLNHILNFTCGHLKAKLPPEITNRTIVFDNTPVVTPPGGISGPTWVSDGEDSWRTEILIKNHMDLAIMDKKTKKSEYKNLAEFETDAHNIMHNIIVYHGEHSTVGEMGITMYQDCCYDLQEIRRCADCYRISNEKSEKLWFCTPCNPPHQLVYAKQKGYPYWPAKVMQIKDDVYDVRFFGGHHMRANIEKVFIRPITVNLSTLQSEKGKWKEVKIKRSAAWNRAFEELERHKTLLAQLGKSQTKDSEVSEDDNGLKPAKIRNVESPGINGSKNSNTSKSLPIFKDLRVKVERLTEESRGDMESTSAEVEDKPKTSTSRTTGEQQKTTPESRKTSEERQVPFLPVAEDEPAREISSTCPQGLRKEGSQEDMVTSSSQEPRSKCVLVQTEQIQTDVLPAKVKRGRRTSDQPMTTALEKLRRELELDKCKELERLQAEHSKEMRQLTDKHQQVISEIKKKQWCYNCEVEAIYHCCWNTAYCSIECQQIHWQREHKRVCRRKR
ncbi:zinc finger MYND domain-containing protein 11 isoform X3 [Athalia rosae]|uniref:zinc finger MYND domain-containing protein 11 isoform X3 n=1 Tax=Athalia rosae TaxID=37344 RepID=UPI002034602E|nr:zinc finger MYND domain-containing protein 11 isoform X3 [Athalia rosae]